MSAFGGKADITTDNRRVSVDGRAETVRKNLSEIANTKADKSTFLRL
jgi:hypothetical protein